MENIKSTDIQGFVIKMAQREDTSLILDFIKRLAEYERLSHEVVATEKDLDTFLFSDRAVAEVIIGYYENKPVGFALFFHNFSTFLGRRGIYLEDLFVLEEYRGRGFGKTLLTYLAKLDLERDCGRLEWAVLNWNEPSILFYKSLGAKVMDEWLVNRLTGDTLKAVAQQFSGAQ
ncbi:MAG TPA: GNAT family N-acetyltransferase [Bacteroidales bacterium]|nr:GNAT family N-acetyltransferase [Bacteroidales bacterium]